MLGKPGERQAGEPANGTLAADLVHDGARVCAVLGAAIAGVKAVVWWRARAGRAGVRPKRKRRSLSCSDIAAEEKVVEGVWSARVRSVLWDLSLAPLLAWCLNIVAVVLAVCLAAAPVRIWRWVACRRRKVPMSVYVEGTEASVTRARVSRPPAVAPPFFSTLMVPASRSDEGRKTLVLDLDETLVHSQIKVNEHCDLRLEVQVDHFPAIFYVAKRPYLDVFLRTVAQWYNVVIFTASVEKYADPLISILDTGQVVQRRLFRQDCVRNNGSFVKDLTRVQPNLADVLIVDNSPAAYSIQPSNAIPIDAWYNDQNDEELLNLIPLLHAIAFLRDVRSLLDLRLTAGALAVRRTRRAHTPGSSR